MIESLIQTFDLQINAVEELVPQQSVAPEPEIIPEEERVTVRLKFLNDTLKDVEASLVENVGQFKRRNFSEEMSSNKNVRLIFNGQVLRDESSSLRSCGQWIYPTTYTTLSN